MAFSFCVSVAQGDEQLFGFVRGAETLPAQRSELYQFITLREGKSEGTYYGSDFETEYEYGFTNRFQASVSLEQHYFYNRGVNGDRDALDDKNALSSRWIVGWKRSKLVKLVNAVLVPRAAKIRSAWRCG